MSERTTTKRICFFAHYDRDGIIDDYVLYYLNGLKEVAERTLFVSDCELQPGEQDKLAGLAEFVSAYRHGEYDFGSWKRCFAYLGDELGKYDELIIANDSCYAPVYPFQGVFERMSSVDCDVWGPTADNNECGAINHLNSYFIVFKYHVATAEFLQEFFNSVQSESCKWDIITKYEKGLGKLLQKNNLRMQTLHKFDELQWPQYPEYFSETIHKEKLSWFKVALARENHTGVSYLKNLLEKIYVHYPRHLIKQHLMRVIGTDNPKHFHYKKWRSPFILKIPYTDRVIAYAKLKRSGWLKYYVYVLGLRIPVFVSKIN